MKLGYIYAGKVIGNLVPGGVDPYTGEPSSHEFLSDLDPSTPSADVYGLHVLMQPGVTPEGSSAILRLEPNMPNGVVLESAIQVPMNASDRLEFLFALSPPTADAWAYQSGTHTGENGFIKVGMGTHTRYIQLYDTYVA